MPFTLYIYKGSKNVFHKNKSRCRDGAKCLQGTHIATCMEKSTGGKTSGTRRGTIPCSTIQVDILRHQRHSGYVFTIPTSGNICGCVYAHAIGKIELGKAIKKYKSSGHIAICQSSL